MVVEQSGPPVKSKTRRPCRTSGKETPPTIRRGNAEKKWAADFSMTIRGDPWRQEQKQERCTPSFTRFGQPRLKGAPKW
jgi:hypothetical protein